jgi:HSP20 family protein
LQQAADSPTAPSRLHPIGEALALVERGLASKRVAFPRWQPAVRLDETDDTLVVRVALPGTRLDAVRVRVAGDLLTLQAERPAEGGRSSRAFARSFLLPVPVAPEAVDAVLSNGTLTVRVDKRRRPATRRIPVQ